MKNEYKTLDAAKLNKTKLENFLGKKSIREKEDETKSEKRKRINDSNLLSYNTSDHVNPCYSADDIYNRLVCLLKRRSYDRIREHITSIPYLQIIEFCEKWGEFVFMLAISHLPIEAFECLVSSCPLSMTKKIITKGVPYIVAIRTCNVLSKEGKLKEERIKKFTAINEKLIKLNDVEINEYMRNIVEKEDLTTSVRDCFKIIN
jgi:hypothetical protein